MSLVRYSVLLLLGALLWAPTVASAATRIFYASDWTGPTQIFAVDPTGRRMLGQVTFDHAETCSRSSLPCGFVDPLPSPNGHYVAYRELGEPGALWLADADGRNARRIADATLDASLGPSGAVNPQRPYAAWSPDSRELAYWTTKGTRFVRANGKGSASGRWFRGLPRADGVISPDGRWLAAVENSQIVVTNRRTRRSRVLVAKRAFRLAWSPDSRALAYVEGSIDFDVATTGDVHVVTLSGRDRTVVEAGGRYGGQIESVAWSRQPARVTYRKPEVVTGVFAGGPVAHIAADGGRVAYAACLKVFAWTPATDNIIRIDDKPIGGCLAPDRRAEIYDLAVAGDRVAWGEKTAGLGYQWFLRQATLEPSVARYALANGSNALGYATDNGGGLAGGHGLLVYSVWNTTTTIDPMSGRRISMATLFRATSTGCPCPAISYSAAPWDFPPAGLTPLIALDTDGSRIVALRNGLVVVLDAFGQDLLSIPVRAAAAQFSGEELVVLVPNELRVYGTSSGTFLRSWPLPIASVGRDCRYYSEPQCPREAELRLQDVRGGLAVYALNGEVHVLRLADGRDTTVGFGTEARFMDAGLAYVDGARIRIVPFSSLR